jgi:hypothetical protein
MPDEPLSETTEQDHVHVCPVCGDGWQHASADCGEPVTALPIAWVRQTWARCPLHEGMDE